MGFCPRSSIFNNCRLYSLHMFYKLCKVDIIHTACVLDSPIHHRGIINCIGKSRFNQIITVDIFTHTHKLALMILITIQGNDRKSGIVFAIVNFDTISFCFLVFQDIWPFRVYLLPIFVVIIPKIIGVAINFVKGSTKRLVIVYLPKSYACFKASILFVKQGLEFK